MDLAAAGPTDEWVFRCSAKAVMAALALAGRAPRFVNDVVVASEGGKPTGDIGHHQVLFNLTLGISLWKNKRRSTLPDGPIPAVRRGGSLAASSADRC